MSGVELAHAVRLGRPDLPILFITGFAGTALPPTDVRQDRLLRKPFHASELAAEVAVLLAECSTGGTIVRLRCPV